MSLNIASLCANFMNSCVKTHEYCHILRLNLVNNMDSLGIVANLLLISPVLDCDFIKLPHFQPVPASEERTSISPFSIGICRFENGVLGTLRC